LRELYAGAVACSFDRATRVRGPPASGRDGPRNTGLRPRCAGCDQGTQGQGVILGSADPVELSAVMTSLFQDNQLRPELGKACRSLGERLTWGAAAEKFVQVLGR